MKPELTIDFHIRWAWHKIAKLYNQEALKYDMTMSIGYMLLNIDPQKGTPSTKLGPKMGMEPRSLTRTLGSMEEKDLICRKPDEEDRRRVHILLTDKGLEKRKVARDTVIRFNKVIQEEMTQEENEQFFHLMKKIRNLLDTKPIFHHEQT